MKYILLLLLFTHCIFAQEIIYKKYLNETENLQSFINTYKIDNNNILIALNENQKSTKIINYNVFLNENNWLLDFKNQDTLFKDYPFSSYGKFVKGSNDNFNYYNLTEYADFFLAFNIKKINFNNNGDEYSSKVRFDSLNLVTGVVYDLITYKNDIYLTTSEFNGNNYIYKYDSECEFLDTFHIKGIDRIKLHSYISFIEFNNDLVFNGIFKDILTEKYSYFIAFCDKNFNLKKINEFEIQSFNQFYYSNLAIINSELISSFQDRDLNTRQLFSQLFKFDKNGELKNQKKLLEGYATNINKITTNEYNEIILIGSQAYSEGNFSITKLNNYLVKYDSDFNLIYEKIWGLDNLSDELLGIEEIGGGKYVVFSHNNYNVELIVIDENLSSIESNKTPIIVYPNPASDYIYIKDENVSKIEIYDVLGHKVLETNYSSEIDIKTLNNSIFQVILYKSDGTRNFSKFVKN